MLGTCGAVLLLCDNNAIFLDETRLADLNELLRSDIDGENGTTGANLCTENAIVVAVDGVVIHLGLENAGR